MSPPSESNPPLEARWPELRRLSVAFFAAWLIGRLLTPALPGLKVGIGHWIERTTQVGQILSQGFLLLGASYVARSAIALMQRRGVPFGYRALSLLLTGCLMALCVPAAATALPTHLSLSLAIMAGVSALNGGALAISRPRSRGLGLVLFLFTAAVIARMGAWQLAEAAGERAWLKGAYAARSLELLSQVIALGAEAMGGLWLLRRGSSRTRSLFLVFGLVALAWLAAGLGSHPAWSSFAQRLAGRMLSALAPATPWNLPGLARTVSAGGLMLSLVALFSDSPHPKLAASLSLVLAAGTNSEVPLCSLAICAASLGLIRYRYEEGQGEAAPDGEEPPEQTSEQTVDHATDHAAEDLAENPSEQAPSSGATSPPSRRGEAS